MCCSWKWHQCLTSLYKVLLHPYIFPRNPLVTVCSAKTVEPKSSISVSIPTQWAVAGPHWQLGSSILHWKIVWKLDLIRIMRILALPYTLQHTSTPEPLSLNHVRSWPVSLYPVNWLSFLYVLSTMERKQVMTWHGLRQRFRSGDVFSVFTIT